MAAMPSLPPSTPRTVLTAARALRCPSIQEGPPMTVLHGNVSERTSRGTAAGDAETRLAPANTPLRRPRCASPRQAASCHPQRRVATRECPLPPKAGVLIAPDPPYAVPVTLNSLLTKTWCGPLVPSRWTAYEPSLSCSTRLTVPEYLATAAALAFSAAPPLLSGA